MRIALVADIHSNLQALEAVSEKIARAGADITLCAGDIVGYGANPNECCRIAKAMAQRSVAGNHDLAALTKDTSSFNPFAARAALWTADQLKHEEQAYLRSLNVAEKVEFRGIGIAIHHGSPSSVDEYVFEDGATQDLMELAKAQVLVLGHTHVPFVREYKGGMIVNPGSVGQPRDGNRRASFAVLDLDEMRCTIERVDYDIGAASRAILEAGLPSVLARRLSSGI
ncbi:MAG TPA: metallophosphoesterase family protein [Thermoplasmata archaeon]